MSTDDFAMSNMADGQGAKGKSGGTSGGASTGPASEHVSEDGFIIGSFDYEGCRYSYRRWGDKHDSALVLLHGFMQSAASWDLVARALAEDHCVYALDLIGHGLSEKTRVRARYAYEDMAVSVDRFLRQCVDSSHVTVVGYSMGGRIALRLLEHSRDVIDALVLESCNLGCATVSEREQAAQRNREWATRLRKQGMEAFVDYWETLPLFATQKELGYDKVLHASRAANDPECMALCLEEAGKHAMPPTAESVALIKRTLDASSFATIPVDVPSSEERSRQRGADTVISDMLSAGHRSIPLLYIYGGKDGRSSAIAGQLGSLGASVSEISAGHNVHLEQMMLYLKEVRKFISSVN